MFLANCGKKAHNQPSRLQNMVRSFHLSPQANTITKENMLVKETQSQDTLNITTKMPISMHPEGIKPIENYHFSNGVETIVSDMEPSLDNSPKKNGFNEITGRFDCNASEDAFVIVFSDSPGAGPSVTQRPRLDSVCSEDSFIVFEDDGDGEAGCFTMDDFSSDCSSESNLESECELDTECDEVDSAGPVRLMTVELGELKMSCGGEGTDTSGSVEEEETSKLVVPQQDREKKTLAVKKVRFSTAPPQVRVLRVWSFAARQARVGSWRQAAADAERFRRRIADVDMAISWVLKPQHRDRVKRRREEEDNRRADEEKKREDETKREVERR